MDSEGRSKIKASRSMHKSFDIPHIKSPEISDDNESPTCISTRGFGLLKMARGGMDYDNTLSPGLGYFFESLIETSNESSPRVCDGLESKNIK